jgi:hypothetical protein
MLLGVKRKWDPESLFWAREAAGGEVWAESEFLLGHLRVRIVWCAGDEGRGVLEWSWGSR